MLKLFENFVAVWVFFNHSVIVVYILVIVIGSGKGHWLGALGNVANAEHKPIMGVWAEPPAESRGRAPGQRVR